MTFFFPDRGALFVVARGGGVEVGLWSVGVAGDGVGVVLAANSAVVEALLQQEQTTT